MVGPADSPLADVLNYAVVSHSYHSRLMRLLSRDRENCIWLKILHELSTDGKIRTAEHLVRAQVLWLEL